jgi:hypothetical protein
MTSHECLPLSPWFVASLSASLSVRLSAWLGGAWRWQSALRAAGISLDLEDEMGAMIAGLDFLLRTIPGEVFTLDMDALGSWTPLTSPADCAELARRYMACTPPPQEYLYVSSASATAAEHSHSTRATTRMHGQPQHPSHHGAMHKSSWICDSRRRVHRATGDAQRATARITPPAAHRPQHTADV